MPRLLLLLPTRTYRTPALLDAAARCGVEITVASEEDSSVGHLNPAGFLTLPFSDPTACVAPVLAFHKRYPIDAVIGIDDSVVEASAAVARALGLPSNDPDAVATARDKTRSRRALQEAEVPCPRSELRDFDGDDGSWKQSSRFPAVVKPLSLSASRGVMRVDSEEEFSVAVSRLRALLESEECGTDPGFLFEEFVEGAEVAVEGLLRDGQLEVLAIFDKPEPLDGPFFEESIYVTPSGLETDLADRVIEVCGEACEALGLLEGAVHIEVRVGPDGPVVIEVNPRAIGGLCGDVLRFGTGVTLEEILLHHALGDRAPLPERETQAAGVLMLPVGGGGRLQSVEGVEAAEAVPGVVRVAITAHTGQQLTAWPEGGAYPGFVFARCETSQEVVRALQAAREEMTLVYAKGPGEIQE